MGNIEKEWWDQEIKVKFQTLEQFLEIFAYFLFVVKFSVFCVWRDSLDQPHQIFPILSTLVIFLLAKVARNWRTELKVLYAFVFAELLNFSLLRISSYLPEHQSILMLSSSLYLVYFEHSMIRSDYIKAVLQLKFIYQWYISQLVSGKITVVLVPTPYGCIVASLIVFYLNERTRNNNSFLAFKYRRDAEESEQKRNALIQFFPEGVLVLNEDFEVELCNENFLEHFTGISKENVIDAISTVTFVNRDSVPHSDFLIEHLKQAIFYEIRQERILGICYLHGNYLEWRCKKIAWTSSQGVLVVTCQKVNELIELERKRSENDFKSLLIKSISHELRTPTNVILNLSKQIKEKECLPESIQQKLAMIIVSSKLLLNIISDLIDYTLILSGDLTILKIRCNLRDILSEVFDMLQCQANFKKLTCSLRIDPQLPEEIVTDPTRLSQILLNLLANALKFTNKGGIELCALQSYSRKIKFIVKDSGIGLSSEKIKRIYEEFAANELLYSTRNISGLGLCISDKLSKLLGGESIRIVSDIGKVTSVSFKIENYAVNSDLFELVQSCSEESPEELPSETQFSCSFSRSVVMERAAVTKTPLVLLVDDGPFNLEVLGNWLTAAHLEFVTALSGEESIEKVKHYDDHDTPIKVVIMDYDMGEMNGPQATAKMQEMFRGHLLKKMPKVIGYSCYSMDEYIRECRQSGMVDYIVKPGSKEEIITAIHQHMDIS